MRVLLYIRYVFATETPFYVKQKETFMSDLSNGDTFFPEETPPEPPKQVTPDRRRLIAGTLFEYVELIVITVCVLLFAALFLFRHTVVDGSSMEPTLKNSEHLIISDLFYKPQVGDIVVFESAVETGLDEPLIKRVIAVEGQTVRIDQSGVSVDGKIIAAGADYLDYNNRLYGRYAVSDMPLYSNEEGLYYLYSVGEGECFVMGDNRFNSHDSRVFGAISEDCILGRAVLRILPLDKFGGLD